MNKKMIIHTFILVFTLLNFTPSITHAKNTNTTAKEIDLKPRKTTYVQWGRYYQVLNTSKNYEAKGIASWYGRQFHRRRTSSGERYNMYEMTAAHRTLPLSTQVLVTNLKNGRKVIVRVNDRGPFVGNRLIDLSYAAARKLGMVGRGLAPVKVKALA